MRAPTTWTRPRPLERTVHALGPLRYRRLGQIREVPAGSPACVTGALADVFRERAALSSDPDQVTCPRCREALDSEVI